MKDKIKGPQLPGLRPLDLEDEEDTDLEEGPFGPVATSPKAKVLRPVVVALTGLEIGRMYFLQDAITTIGRDRRVHIRSHEKGLSREHARIVREGGRYFVEDLGSRNGTYVDGVRARRGQRMELREGARITLSANVVLRFDLLDEIEERMTKQLFEASTRDALMGIYNRRYFDERITSEVSFAHRHRVELALVLFDIDRFKEINDTHGHQAGDSLLVGIAKKAATVIRTEDVLARYGGEEIAIIVRGIPLEGLKVLGERMRRAVAESVFPHRAITLRATVSVGIAMLEECGAKAAVELLVALADERLYRAKQTGRNRVCAE